MKCSLTPMRRAWLEALANGGETPWRLMPKKISKSAAICASNRTWKSMIEVGWITGEFRQRGGLHCDWWFAITDEGRKQLESKT